MQPEYRNNIRKIFGQYTKEYQFQKIWEFDKQGFYNQIYQLNYKCCNNVYFLCHHLRLCNCYDGDLYVVGYAFPFYKPVTTYWKQEFPRIKTRPMLALSWSYVRNTQRFLNFDLEEF